MASSTRFSLLLLLLFFSFRIEAFQFDLETSLLSRITDFEESKFSLYKIGVGIKKNISDDKGDRFQFFLRAEAEENFSENKIAQLYAKYKGPMGRWNFTFGRSFIPFGLLTDYDSEMLIIKTQEHKTIGYRTSDGLKFSGFWRSIDYELFLGLNNWEKNLSYASADKMAGFKISYKGYDPEDLKIGLSFLAGELSDGSKLLAGIDITKYHNLLVGRAEIAAGKEADKNLLSVFTGIDYGIFPSVDLNLAYTYFKSDFDENAVFCGFTYNTPFRGTILRAGNKYYFEDETGDDKNEIFIQIHIYFGRYF